MEIKPIKEEKAIVYPNKSNIAKGTISLMSTMNTINTDKIIFDEDYFGEALVVAVVSTVPPIIKYIGITWFVLILLNILSILMIIKNTFNKKKYVKANDGSKIKKYINKLRKNYRFFWISLAILWIVSFGIVDGKFININELIISISKLLVQILPVIILIRLAYLTTNIIECIVNNKKSNSKKSNIKYVLSLIGLIVLMRSYYI